MRILHTSDWHVGKRLGRHDRMDEFARGPRRGRAHRRRAGGGPRRSCRATSGTAPCRRWTPSRSGWRRWCGSAERRPVVVVAGNHDSPELFETLAPFLRPLHVFLIGDIKRPDAGALIGPGGARRARRRRRPPLPARGPRRRLHARRRRVVPRVRGAHRRPRRPLQRGARRARGRRQRADPHGALHGRRRPRRPLGAPRRAGTAHGRGLRRHGAGDPTRPPVRGAWATSTRRRRCRARRCRPSTLARCSRSTSARPARPSVS